MRSTTATLSGTIKNPRKTSHLDVYVKKNIKFLNLVLDILDILC